MHTAVKANGGNTKHVLDQKSRLKILKHNFSNFMLGTFPILGQ